MNKKLLLTFLMFSIGVSILNCNNTSYAQTQNVYEIGVTQNVSISKANELLKEGNVDGAINMYNSILEKNPNSIPARLGVAKIYGELFKIKAAQREFERVLSQDPNNSDAHNGLGMTYYRLTTSSNMAVRDKTGSLYRLSSEEFKKAIESNPNNDEALANLGMIYQQQGRLEEAENNYRQALTINPNNSNANYRLGTIIYEKGDVDSAIAYYNKSLEVDSKNSSAHFHLGEALVAKGEYSKAIEELQTSLYLYPNSAPVHEKLGEAYKHQGNETAAIEEFKKAIAIKPEDTLPYLLLSSVYEDRNDEELSIAELKSALKNNPDFSEAKLKIANMSLKLNKTDQSIEYYKSALLDDPGNPEAEKGLSKAYFRKVQADVASGIVASPSRLLEAEKSVDKAISNNPDDLELHYAQFKLEKMSNKPEPTPEELKTVAESVPSNVPQALDKGYALLKLQDFQQANSIFRGLVNQQATQEDKLMLAETLVEYKALDVAGEIFNNTLKEDPKNVEAQRGLERIKQNKTEALENYRLGWDLFKKGQRKSAYDQFKKAQVADPYFEKAYYWAAETLKKDDKFGNAYENYKTFLSLTETQNITNDEDLIKRRSRAEKMLKKLEGKEDKE